MTKPRRARRAGSRWRLLVHTWRGKTEGYGTAHDLRNYRRDPVRPLGYTDAEYERHRAKVEGMHAESVAQGWSKDYDLTGTEFDELVVDHWLHIEALDTGYWYLHIGGVAVHVRADRDGRAKHVTVHGPGDWLDPEQGCKYEQHWSQQ